MPANIAGPRRIRNPTGELSTEEAKALIDTFPSVGNPIIIFTGGDPMIRPDVYELIAYAGSKGLRCVMSPNGTLITPGKRP